MTDKPDWREWFERFRFISVETNRSDTVWCHTEDVFQMFKSRLLEETTAIPREDKG